MHGQILRLLSDQRKKDRWSHGGIGWDVARNGRPYYNREKFYQPLLDRRLVEPCTRLQPAGEHFVRVTDFGLLCLDLGIMPKLPITGSDTLAKYALEAQSSALKHEPKTTEGAK
jgi:hypothetical protein